MMFPKQDLESDDARDGGFTIIELLVTMLVTGVVLAMMGTFFANISRLTNWAGNDRTATGQAAVAIDAIRAAVRTAVKTSDTPAGSAVQYASATKLQIVAYSGIGQTTANPQLVTFCLAGDALKVNTQTATAQDTATKAWVFPNATILQSDSACARQTDWRVVASGFSTTAASPFFTYLDTSSQPIRSVPLSPTDRTSNVTFIQVIATLDSTQSNASGKPVIVTSSIGMPGVTRDVDPSATVPNLPTPTQTPTPTPTPTRSTASATPSSSTTSPGSSGGSGTGTGTGSGSGTGPGTSTGGTGTGGSGGTAGGGSGTSTPAPSSSSPKPTTTTTTTTKPPTTKPSPPQVIDY